MLDRLFSKCNFKTVF